jgi:hypothetical protein
VINGVTPSWRLNFPIASVKVFDNYEPAAATLIALALSGRGAVGWQIEQRRRASKMIQPIGQFCIEPRTAQAIALQAA